MKKRAIVAMSVLLAACSPQTQRPEIDAARSEQERQLQKEIAFEDITASQFKVRRLAMPLLIAAAPMCPGSTQLIADFEYDSAYLWPVEQQQLMRKLFKLDEHPRVTHVWPGLSAARAGIQVGDIVSEINGVSILPTSDSKKELAARIKDEKVLNVKLQRDRETIQARVERLEACQYATSVKELPEINAYADGDSVFVTTAMLRFVRNDEELALVLGHEIAHNARRHISAKRGNAVAGQVVGTVLDVLVAVASRGATTKGTFGKTLGSAGAGAFSQDFELEADYVGLYIMARAGLPIADAPKFWRRMAVANPTGISHASTHPTTPERFIALEDAIKEIAAKKATGVALLPNETGRTMQSASPADN